MFTVIYNKQIKRRNNMKIITGHTGKNHVESDDDRYLHAGIFGKGSYVLNTGTKLNAEIVTSNIIRIGSGDIMHQGTHARIPYGEYEDVTIDNGTTGYKRIDCIYAMYNKIGGIESVELEVLKGTPDASDPAAPGYAEYDILEGNTLSPMLLYEVELDGVNIVRVTSMFKVVTFLDNVYDKAYINEIKKEMETNIEKAQKTADTAKNTSDKAYKALSYLKTDYVLNAIGTLTASSSTNCAQFESTDVSGTFTISNPNGKAIVIPQNTNGFMINTKNVSWHSTVGENTFVANVTRVASGSAAPSLTFTVLYFDEIGEHLD